MRKDRNYEGEIELCTRYARFLSDWQRTCKEEGVGAVNMRHVAKEFRDRAAKAKALRKKLLVASKS